MPHKNSAVLVKATPPAVRSGVPKPISQWVTTGDADQRQDAGGDQALVERAHDRLAGAELDEEGADDRGDDADAADGERTDHHVGRAAAVPAKKIAARTMVATVVTA